MDFGLNGKAAFASGGSNGILKDAASMLVDEVARYGITCNIVAPGWIGTENSCNYLEKKMGNSHNPVPDLLFDAIPAKRVGRPKEIASTIAYLCSYLAAYISGNWIVADGGKHASAFWGAMR